MNGVIMHQWTGGEARFGSHGPLPGPGEGAEPGHPCAWVERRVVPQGTLPPRGMFRGAGGWQTWGSGKVGVWTRWGLGS